MSEVSPIDPTKASVARAYDYVLGGKDNFDIDREFAHKILERDPEVAVAAKLNKAFGRRVVEYMAQQGIRQFLDLGSGIPTSPPSVHDTAREVRPDAKVVYVDYDPVVVAHNQALSAFGTGLSVIHADLLDTQLIFSHKNFKSNIDPKKPIGVLLLSVLQNSTDEQAALLMRDLKSRLASGSYLAITHVSTRTSEAVQDAFATEIAANRYPWMTFRSEEHITGWFDGLDLVHPGVIDHRDWRPTPEEEDTRPELNTLFSSGVGRYR